MNTLITSIYSRIEDFGAVLSDIFNLNQFIPNTELYALLNNDELQFLINNLTKEALQTVISVDPNIRENCRFYYKIVHQIVDSESEDAVYTNTFTNLDTNRVIYARRSEQLGLIPNKIDLLNLSISELDSEKLNNFITGYKHLGYQLYYQTDYNIKSNSVIAKIYE